jgi:hypothetical protein
VRGGNGLGDLTRQRAVPALSQSLNYARILTVAGEERNCQDTYPVNTSTLNGPGHGHWEKSGTIPLSFRSTRSPDGMHLASANSTPTTLRSQPTVTQAQAAVCVSAITACMWRRQEALHLYPEHSMGIGVQVRHLIEL